MPPPRSLRSCARLYTAAAPPYLAPVPEPTKIRYNHAGASATIVAEGDGKTHVILHAPQRAVPPGQACVFYQDDVVVGGGWIACGPS